SGSPPLHLDTEGALVLPTPGGALRLHPPVVYQDIAGVRQPIPCQYELVPGPAGADGGGTAQLRVQVAVYDRRQPLIIDPVLSYSTYLGGSPGVAAGLVIGGTGAGIAVDGTGQAYVTGDTPSGNFPTTPGAFQPALGGDVSNAFVTKLNASG